MNIMSRESDEVSKLTESTYKNVMEQFNPGLRNLVNLGKSYEKAVAAMTLAGKLYFDAMSKIGENAAVSPVSRELGVVLINISEVHRKVHLELEENFRRFHTEIISELERKTDMDVKYMTATFKRYQMEHKLKQDSLERSQSDLKKLRRKSQGKNANKYENKESECLETLSSRQVEMQKFIADGCQEALLEEKRRFCFLVDKHCTFSFQTAAFHDKARDILSTKLTSWQDQCSSATNMPENIMTKIETLRTAVPVTPLPSPATTPATTRHSVNYTGTGRDSMSVAPPPAPAMKAQTSPLANMFTERNTEPATSVEESAIPRSVSVSSGLNNIVKKPRVRTIFPHAAGDNNTLLSFDEGETIILLIPDERDGWMYGALEKSGKRGWFPSSYCRAFSEPLVNNNSMSSAPYRSRSVVNLHHQDTETDEATMVLPPADYSDTPRPAAATTGYSQSPARRASGGGGYPAHAHGLATTTAKTTTSTMPTASAKAPAATPVSTASVNNTNNHHHHPHHPRLAQHSPTPSAASSTSSSTDNNATVNQSNGTHRPPPPYLAGGNPFSTVRLRPTVTSDRSAPVI